MIRIQSAGRLGNQLFQVAMGLHLREQYNCKLRIFSDSIHTTVQSPFHDLTSVLDLQLLGIDLREDVNYLGYLLASLDKISGNRASKEAKVFESLLGIHRERRPYHLSPLPKTQPRVITGFFQDPDGLLSEVIFLANQISEKLKIKNTRDYQVLHVRRFDSEVGLPMRIGHEYFIRNLKVDLPIVICSDDPTTEFTFRRLLPDFDFFSPKNSTTQSSFQIMAQAQHIVISNSTYSWWASLIAHLMGASVIVPSHWDARNEIPKDHFRVLEFQSDAA